MPGGAAPTVPAVIEHPVETSAFLNLDVAFDFLWDCSGVFAEFSGDLLKGIFFV
jgi:hypothetical protein